MKSESTVPARIRAWLDEPVSEVSRRIAEELKSGTAPELVLQGMQNHAVRLGAAGDLRALETLDAVADLLPILGPRSDALLLSSVAYLRRLEPRALHPEWCERAPLSESPIVYAGSLDEALEAKTLEEAGATIARLLSVVQTEEYFHELLLEAAARHWEAPGRTLIGASVVVRALTGRRWAEGREFVFRLVESLHRARIPRLAAVSADPGPLPLAAAFLVAARSARNLPVATLYLCHAFQADRACRLRQKQIRQSIGPALAAWFPGLAGMAPGWRPAPRSDPDALPSLVADVEAAGTSPSLAADAGAAGTSPSLAPETGEALLALMEEGRTTEAEAAALRLLEETADPDPIFGWIALAATRSLEAGDPMPLLLANSARWGAHLLAGESGELVARVVREVCASSPA